MSGRHRRSGPVAGARVAEASTGLIVRATVLSSVLTVLGALLGLVRDLLLASLFGATGATDAFLVAWTVPETASTLLIEGAMAFLMVPIFVRALTDGTGLAAVVRATLPRIAVLLTLASAAIAAGAPVLVRALAPGLAEPALGVTCTRIIAITVLAFGIAGYLSAALRSAHVFGWPAAIYVAYNAGILAAMALLHKPIGVVSAALGVAVGSLLMIAIQLPSFLRWLGPAPLARLGRRPEIALGAFVPIAAFTVIRQAQVFVERYLGSNLTAGTISHLNYAQKVAQVPMVLSVMMAIVTYPMLARSVAVGDRAGTRGRAESDVRVVSAIVLLSSAYLVAFAPDILQVLFQRGAFTAADTAATAAIMRVYALGLLGQAMVGVLGRSYFSQARSIWYPAAVMGLGLVATAVISASLLRLWGGVAIAAGNAAGITITAGLMLYGLRGPDGLSLSTMAHAIGRLTLIAGAAGIVGWLVSLLMTELPAVAAASAGAVVVIAVFLLLGALTRAEETRQLINLLRKVRHAG